MFIKKNPKTNRFEIKDEFLFMSKILVTLEVRFPETCAAQAIGREALNQILHLGIPVYLQLFFPSHLPLSSGSLPPTHSAAHRVLHHKHERGQSLPASDAPPRQFLLTISQVARTN